MKKLLFIFTLMALVLSACAAAAVSGSQTEIGQNKDKWQDANISHYRYELFISCFCAFNEDMPLIIEVQDGKVVSMEFQSGNEIDPSLRADLFDKYATIDGLFAELEAAQNGAADKVTIEYDATYGFPTKADIDFEEMAIDDELYLTISNFEVLP
ncbi:MAG TPA: DUF6174 domain-containing protein [Anaerolineales bacterium]